MLEWRQQARAALDRGPAALVTILATEGSAPRGAGTRMIVTGEGFAGTIGGGALEYRVTQQARVVLGHPPGTWRVQDYPLGPLLGQCCGGRVRLLVERMERDMPWPDAETLVAELTPGRVARSVGRASPMPARGPLPGIGARFVEPEDRLRTPLLLFGAGHVGRAIADRVPGLPFTLGWFDTRAEADAPGVLIAGEDVLAACAAAAAPDSAILIMTHDHGMDYRLAAAALQGPARFVGVIGSVTKRARFLSRLRADGIDAARLTCPIGLPQVVGKEPGVIAIGVLAQLLALDP